MPDEMIALETITLKDLLEALPHHTIFTIRLKQGIAKFDFSVPLGFIDKTQEVRSIISPDESLRIEVLIRVLADFVRSRLEKELIAFEHLLLLLHYLLQVNVDDFACSDKEDFSEKIRIFLLDLYVSISDIFFKDAGIFSFFARNIEAGAFKKEHFMMLIQPIKVLGWNAPIEEIHSFTYSKNIASLLIRHVSGMTKLLTAFSEQEWEKLSTTIGLSLYDRHGKLKPPNAILAEYWGDFLIEKNLQAVEPLGNDYLGFPGEVWFAEENMLRFARFKDKISIEELETLLEDLNLQAKQCKREAFVEELQRISNERRSNLLICPQTMIHSYTVSSHKSEITSTASPAEAFCVLQ